MARIYNYMGDSILVIPGLNYVIGEIPTGAITIPSGQRSDSLSWTSANGLVILMNNTVLCTFNFGLHAQIQGGNYAIIAPGSYLVYDSNHDIIATGG